MKLKVCGMRETENIGSVALRNPDFMGFIFHRASPRHVGDQFSIPDLPGAIARVGVFVEQSADEIIFLQKRHSLDFIQLHGGQSESTCSDLKERGLQIIKVFSVGSSFDFNIVKKFAGLCDYFMFDTKSDEHGGSGKRFDWNLLNKYRLNVPFFLSGGLNLSNIDEALALNHPQLFSLDVNSGIEIEPGLKDVEKLDLIIKQIRK